MELIDRVLEQVRMCTDSGDFMTNLVKSNLDVNCSSNVQGEPMLRYRKVTTDEIINVFECYDTSGRRKPLPSQTYIKILGKNAAKTEECFIVKDPKENEHSK